MRSLRSVYSEKPELQPQSNKSFVIRYSEFVVLKLIFMSHCYLSLGLFCFDGCVLLQFYFLFSFSVIICFAFISLTCVWLHSHVSFSWLFLLCIHVVFPLLMISVCLWSPGICTCFVLLNCSNQRFIFCYFVCTTCISVLSAVHPNRINAINNVSLQIFWELLMQNPVSPVTL